LRPREWFRPSLALDARLRRRFGRELAMLAHRPAREFLDHPRAALAAVLLFDQIPRNIHRGTPRAFAHDALARRIAVAAMDRGWDRRLDRAERQFLALPLMHSERIADQLASLAVFARLGRRFGWPYARSHYRVIARFGRFPHRNPTLGRESTPAEERAVAAGFAW
jgi:uncharacterized protein (DUF924 family)